MWKREQIAIVDFGSQYTHLISNRVRNLGVFCEIYQDSEIPKMLNKKDYIKGIILSGSPSCVSYENSPKLPKEILEDFKVPVIGFCYGYQLLCLALGGTIKSSKEREYGLAELETKESVLFEGLEKKEKIWMSHGDSLDKLPENCEVIGSTDDCENAAFENTKDNIYGLQFHPEVSHTLKGKKILSNFLYKICRINDEWQPKDSIEEIAEEIKTKCKENNKVLMLFI